MRTPPPGGGRTAVRNRRSLFRGHSVPVPLSSTGGAAAGLGARIVPIDGAHLARLMIAFNIGCRDKSVLHVRQIDEGYFDETAS